MNQQTRVVVIQHVLEQKERSNTARHAAEVLERFELRVFGAQGQVLKVDDLGGAWLLWPGEGTPIGPLPDTLVVLDGSWSQARKMMQRVPELMRLPKLSLVAPPGRRSLREAPPGGMSSLEAMAEGIAFLGGADEAAELRAVHERLVQKQISERGYAGPQGRS